MNTSFLAAVAPEGGEWKEYRTEAGAELAVPAGASVELRFSEIASGDAGEVVRKLAALEAFFAEKGTVVVCTAARKKTEKDGAGLTDADAKVRDAAVETLRGQIALAGKFGGFGAGGQSKKLFVGEWVGNIGKAVPFKVENRFVNGMRALAEDAERAGVTLLVSFVNRYERDWMTGAEEVLAMLDKVGRPNCKLAFDLFHANIEEAGAEAALERYLGKIDHLYLSESNRDAVGSGHIDFRKVAEILKAGGYAGTVTFRSRRKAGESDAEVAEGLAQAREKLAECGLD